MFELRGVSFNYDKRGQAALSDVTLNIRSGVTTAVLGLSGSGKSTFLNILGLLSDGSGHQGEVDFDSQPYSGQDATTAARLRREEFGFVLQSPYMLPHFTCGDNIGMPLHLQNHSPKEVDRRVTSILEAADPSGKLLALKDRLARDVSGGERQRMAVLRAVIHDPRVLFADEPLSSLDFENSQHILQLVNRWKSGSLHESTRDDRSLVLVTHDIDVAWDEAEDFTILRRDGYLAGDKVWTKRELEQLGGKDKIRSLMSTAKIDGARDSQQTRAAARSRSLGFLFWFAWKNLWERSARRSTWINVISLAFVVGFTMIAIGLTKGIEEARLNELREDPLNLCFWVGSSVQETPIDSAFADGLRSKIAQRVGEESLQGVHTFSQTNFVWHDASGKFRRRVYGRTISPEDPMLKSVKLTQGKHDFLKIADRGVIVSPGMLLGLDYDEQSPPRTLVLEPPAGGSVPVPILGVTVDALPFGHDFVIGEQFEAELLAANPNPAIDKEGQRFGPIPGDWPAIAELPPDLRQMFADWRLMYPPGETTDKDDRRFWTLNHNGLDQRPRLSDIRIYVTRINEVMAEDYNFSSDPELANLKLAGNRVDAVELREKHDFAGIYFVDLEALGPAADVCREEGVQANEDVVAQLEAIGGQTKAILAILGFIGIAFGCVVAINMAIVQVLRNEQKVAEIGMLKAIGMTPGRLGGLALVESCILWSFGTCLGLLSAASLGPAMARLAGNIGGTDFRTGFVFSWEAILLAAFASLFICLLSNYLATRKSRNQAASASLRAA